MLVGRLVWGGPGKAARREDGRRPLPTRPVPRISLAAELLGLGCIAFFLSVFLFHECLLPSCTPDLKGLSESPRLRLLAAPVCITNALQWSLVVLTPPELSLIVLEDGRVSPCFSLQSGREAGRPRQSPACAVLCGPETAALAALGPGLLSKAGLTQLPGGAQKGPLP